MTGLPYPRVTERLFNTPLLIHPGKLDAIIAGLAPRLGVNLANFQPEAYTTGRGDLKREGGYRVVNGVGVIDVFGPLAHRTRMEADSSWVEGYQTIARRFENALADREVQSIVLNLESPGGEVGGVQQLAEQVRSAAGIKPIVAVADGMAASAAYWIASAADSISVSPTGLVGSIGVVMRHVDFSKFLAQEGVKVTHIFAGAHKVDGNAYEPLPDDVRTAFQREINMLYDMFVDAVAENRGMTTAQIRATEANVFWGAEAVKAGLADAVETADQVIARLASATGHSTVARTGAKSMSDDNPRAGDANQPDKQFTQADLDAARNEGVAEGKKTGAADERTRIGAILNHEAAEGRQAMAIALATETDLNAEAAAKVMQSTPVAKLDSTTNKPTGAPDFKAAMAQTNTGIAGDAGGDGDESDDQMFARLTA